MLRFSRSKVRNYFKDLWSDIDAPPWIVSGVEIERRKVELLIPYVRNVRRVVDLGCGGGDFFSLLRGTGALTQLEEAVGTDVAENAIARAKRGRAYTKLATCEIEATHEHFEGTADLVLLSDVLYYLDYFEDVVEYVARKLTTKGTRVFVSVAVGRDYFSSRDVEALRSRFRAVGGAALFEDTLDYHFFRVVPRRWAPTFLFAQTHKFVALYEMR